MSVQVDQDRIDAEVRRAAGKGLPAGAIFFKARLQELLSSPAPRKRVLGKRGALAGVYYYRATTRATPGAPPRKLSGRFRSAQTYELSSDKMRARIGSNAKQARRLEEEGHPHLRVTLDRFREQLGQIIGAGMQS